MNVSDDCGDKEWYSLVINKRPTCGNNQNEPCLDEFVSLDHSPTILGIHEGHTASACILKNGKIVSAVEEERLTRIKNQLGFPRQAILRCLDIANISVEEVDFVACSNELMSVGAGTREERKKEYLGQTNLSEKMRSIIVDKVSLFAGRGTVQAIRKRLHEKRQQERLALIAELGIEPSRVHFVEHHQCHAASAYYGCGKDNDDILVLTNDGQGDGLCATVSVGSGGRLYRLCEVDLSHSIGNLYGMVTFVLGMVPLEHEFKVMGMAPYAAQEYCQQVCDIFWGLFEDDPQNPLGWRKKPNVGKLMDYQYIRSLLELQRFDNICGGLQQFTEEILERWALRAIKKTGIRRLAVAGGVFMNVKANQRLMKMPEVEDIFVFPSCADETISIGAAYQVAADYYASRSKPVHIEPIRDLYLGPKYSDDEIKAAIDKFEFGRSVEVIHPGVIETEVANLLANGEIVARFSGREEFGARALGNRSILADPVKEDAIRIINEMIKQRDFWMPFAMSVLPERIDNYVYNEKGIKAPYMIFTFDCHKEFVNEIRASIHPYDQTTRPQVVYEAWNQSYYKIIKEFERLTGRGAILNTSFNLHGFPLVSNPLDALNVFKNSGLMNLAIGPYLVKKNDD